MSVLHLILIPLALTLGLTSTLAYTWEWLGVALHGGNIFCGIFSPAGSWMYWVELMLEPAVLGSMLIIQLGAIVWVLVKLWNDNSA